MLTTLDSLVPTLDEFFSNGFANQLNEYIPFHNDAGLSLKHRPLIH